MNKKKYRNFLNYFDKINKFNISDSEIMYIYVAMVIILNLMWNIQYNKSISIDNIRTVLLIILVMLCIFTILWLKREMDIHYKLKANERTIENLLSKVSDQEEEIKRLTEVSKISHKTNHQIDILKNKFVNNDCKKILVELNELSSNYREKISAINKIKLLNSTKVEKVDEVLEYVLNEASKNKIDFVIKINGSINYMINNYIEVDKLVTLLSDHLKNAIISINHSKNPFRSITLNIGELGDYYGIAVHDSGIEFKVKTLINLGLKPTTTHKKDGGTGVGFMETFETLNVTKASLIINETKPKDYNYTKIVVILFDGKERYKINSYRSKEINEVKKRKIIVTNKKNFW